MVTVILPGVKDIIVPECGEDPLVFCRRLFGGEKFRCRGNGCHAEIEWNGVCDRCMKAYEDARNCDAPTSIEDRLQSIGVPPKMATWQWTGVELPPRLSLAHIRAWTGEPPLFTLVGKTGTGKTGVASCMARDWLLNGRRVKWLYVPDWLDSLRYLEREGDSYTEMTELQNRSGLLILDEVVTNRTTGYGLDRVLQLIDGRDRALLPTVITSNLPPFRTRRDSNGPSIQCLADLEERIASRLASGHVVALGGNDRRRA